MRRCAACLFPWPAALARFPTKEQRITRRDAWLVQAMRYHARGESYDMKQALLIAHGWHRAAMGRS